MLECGLTTWRVPLKTMCEEGVGYPTVASLCAHITQGFSTRVQQLSNAQSTRHALQQVREGFSKHAHAAHVVQLAMCVPDHPHRRAGLGRRHLCAQALVIGRQAFGMH